MFALCFSICVINFPIYASSGAYKEEKETSLPVLKDATMDHAVVQSYSYKLLSRNNTPKLITKTKYNAAEFVILMIPYVGALYAAGKTGDVYYRYESTYSYTCRVGYYDSMGHYLYSRTYTGKTKGYDFKQA